MKVTDPVCNMTIEPVNAAGVSEYKGNKYYFCAKHCKEKFDKNPETYTGKKSVKSLSLMMPTAKGTDNVTKYTCPMDPEILKDKPGSCPICGMALEPLVPTIAIARTEWICPMHPEVVSDSPGDCLKCGMALEPKTVSVEGANPELIDMTRRFWAGVILTIPLVLIAMRGLIPGLSLESLISHEVMKWMELVLATPVVLWGGWPFFVRGWQSLM
ncbi:MAG: heavy metal-binding domain-containing protein, partial [Syntrophales bacterium]|nr:heavy metal-binding domain-containing protein [Syntrophales bacterium]